MFMWDAEGDTENWKGSWKNTIYEHYVFLLRNRFGQVKLDDASSKLNTLNTLGVGNASQL